MLILKKVAVTGGISSGKSTVTGIFQKLGAYVVSADQIAHQFLSSSTALNEIVAKPDAIEPVADASGRSWAM